MAVALKEAAEPSFVEYIHQVKSNAAALARHLQNLGYSIVTNGTDNHIVLWDARSTGLSGTKIEKALEWCGISVNKNTIFGDSSALNPGGVRLGTLAMTTRGMKEEDMEFIACTIHQVVQIAAEVETSCKSLVNGDLPINTSSGPVKLKSFVSEAKRELYISKFSALKDIVRSYASKFHLPGRVP